MGRRSNVIARFLWILKWVLSFVITLALNSYSCWVSHTGLISTLLCAQCRESLNFLSTNCTGIFDISALKCYLVLLTSRLSHGPTLPMSSGLLLVEFSPFTPSQILLRCYSYSVPSGAFRVFCYNKPLATIKNLQRLEMSSFPFFLHHPSVERREEDLDSVYNLNDATGFRKQKWLKIVLFCF